MTTRTDPAVPGDDRAARAEIRVDARGMRCPWPALRLGQAIRRAPEGAVIVILADDPRAPAELAAVAQQAGWIVMVERDATGPAGAMAPAGTTFRFIAARD